MASNLNQAPSNPTSLRVPRHPMLGWSTFAIRRPAGVPAVTDSAHAAFTWSGRSALLLALKAAGIGTGDRVLVPDYYCPTMIAPILIAGAEPVFYPINSSAAPVLSWMERSNLDGAKAMLAVHYFGLPQPFDAVAAICRAKNIALIEDCAHAYFGSVDGRAVGSWGDYAIASLPKFFPVLQGGMLLSRSRQLKNVRLAEQTVAANVRAAWDLFELSTTHGRLPGLNRLGQALESVKRALRRRDQPPLASLVTEIETPEQVRTSSLADPLLGPVQIRGIDRWIVYRTDRQRLVEFRRRNYNLFGSLLDTIEGGHALFPELPEGAVPYVYPIRLDEADKAYYALRVKGYPVFRWDRLWPQATAIEQGVGRDWARSVLQLACHQDLTEHDIESIARTLCNSLRA